MSLVDKIKSAIVDELNSVLDVYSVSCSDVETKIINDLLKSGDLKESELNTILENVIINQAKKDYNYLISMQKKSDRFYPDHAIHPEFLAYAIKNNKLEGYPTEAIRFDHGENPQTFGEQYCPENLVLNLKNRLLNPMPEPSKEELEEIGRSLGVGYDPHPVCPCGH